MKIGFYHTCVMDWDIDRTFSWAGQNGFAGIELHGGPRYKHVNWHEIAKGNGVSAILAAQEHYGVPVTGLMFGAIPFLSPDPLERERALQEIDVLLRAAKQIGAPVVSTFTGRNPLKTLEENIDLYEKAFTPIAEQAEACGIKLAFENCPMYEFWPPVYNIAVSPVIWREMFARVPSAALGLNFDPSHLVWQGIDYAKAVKDFGDRIFIAQAKDTEVLPHVLREEGMLTCRWWRHRIPGHGDVDWGKFITALHEIGYSEILSIEHEDPIWSGTEEKVEQGLLHAKKHLERFI
ncbi:sugar phosphate isomerase/epimerase family protein [Paenibacillus piri]|uniref:Sugar phosphate isomerase/epimerase n=1 Tax=Paenibacillus piri TaxID=2547395 RepID=A0A4R5KTA2_9BACL|nr:sugar phosphate isomerase/epimerase [Paenibacillus piri]TDF98117.1 sugar phosphate isomerase/epimerase [Paenibacillus piri]